MKRSSWHTAALVAVATLSTIAAGPWARAQETSQDVPLSVVRGEVEDPEAKSVEADQDDPRARMEWERETWGVVTPEFRANAIKEGKKHSDKKTGPGPKWVSIGPAGA